LITEPYTVVKNRFGTASVLDQKGFKYSNPPTARTGTVSIWKCSKRKRGHCMAAVQILGEYIIQHFGEHNHVSEYTDYTAS
jgi:hypothetical protein